jgi:hypothetical protein
MSENQEEACREIEKLRDENSQLRDQWLEATDDLLS